jgi:hypothetical protein
MSEPAKSDPKTAELLREAIAKRAYELYLQRGSVPGYELEDWLAAEAELTAAAAIAETPGRGKTNGHRR